MLLRCSQDYNIECITDNLTSIINENDFEFKYDVPIILYGISEQRDYDIAINASYKLKDNTLNNYKISYNHPEIFDREMDDNPSILMIGLHRKIRENISLAVNILLEIMGNILSTVNENIKLSQVTYQNIKQETNELDDVPEFIIKLQYPAEFSNSPILYLMLGIFGTIIMMSFFFILVVLRYFL